MKFFLIQLLFVLFGTSLIFSQTNVKITGNIQNKGNFDKIYLEDIVTQQELASTDLSDKGDFSLEATVDKANFYRLRLDQENYLILIIEPNENISVKADVKELYSPEIKGSKNSSLIYSTFKSSQEFDEKIEKYAQKVQKEKQVYLRKFILDNLNSLSTLFFIDELSIENDFDVYKKLDKSLYAKYPDNFLVLELHKKVQGADFLSIGSAAPEIDLPNPEGVNIKLSSLRGKYVLIDFWAAWCRPCRFESPNMVKLYDTYNKKGFEIYSVSLDKTKEAWVKAIQQDGLGKWTHVSDLQYWNSAAGRDYGVESIPFTVLIDKEGKIIAKGLRGEDLEKKLAEIFN
ncbi:MAG: AhpC/TSA family protein [Bacteroidales bacterium]|nr:AhpC/TSA family protein [Bacteroidales bacterium]